ncbi:hypothetical protein IE077_000579 [Cardiosporidium cionae]|uniref:Uncharacterized protein n=1 Tax=Cardiosporidium cionae TaxID=476202 RepID=A0ABQ7J7R5_9APIC|nr:hypothetical protein IE077_000579 [Cardiosporidium cionae]|eukprot:KAF8820031.1 hypothetical protein IE077_000579 [Cardiosporidium cionae]
MVPQCWYSSHILRQTKNYFSSVSLTHSSGSEFLSRTAILHRIPFNGKYNPKMFYLSNYFYSKFFHSAVYNRQASWSWWDLYIKGECPDFPPRKRAYEYLSSKGVDVRAMDISEIEVFTKWLETKRLYQKSYPQFPYELLFEDKVIELLQKYPLE